VITLELSRCGVVLPTKILFEFAASMNRYIGIMVGFAFVTQR
jgi:hypothetical protein